MKQDNKPSTHLQQWQIEDIEKAIKEADAGLFATHKEVEDFFDKRTA